MVLRALPLFRTTIFIPFVIFACLPLVQMTIISFVATLPQADTKVGSLTLGNYANILANPNLFSAFGNSIAYVLINVGITVPVAMFAERICELAAVEKMALRMISSALSERRSVIDRSHLISILQCSGDSKKTQKV